MEEVIARDRTVMAWVLALSIAAAILMWLVASPRWMMGRVTQEAVLLSDVYGEARAEEMVRRASGIGLAMYRGVTSFLSQRRGSQWAATRGQTARWLFTFFVLRIESAFYSVLLLLPVVLASLWDGWVQRAISREAKGYINPVRFNIGVYLLHAGGILPFVLLVYPGALHPLWFAGYWLLLAVGGHLALKYLQHRL